MASTHPKPVEDIAKKRMNVYSLCPGVPSKSLSLKLELQSQYAGRGTVVTWSKSGKRKRQRCTC